jgi:glycosyltransferase involved in cell wall biosynthesis
LNGYFRRHPDCGTIYLHGPPFSPFLAIRHWAGKAGKRVVYDFRDPWSLDSDYFYPFEFLKNVVRKWEARILKSSSSIVVISDLFRQRLIEMEPTVSEHSFVITNGFDPEDTDFIRTRIPPKFVIAHGGSLEGRDPVSLLRGVARFLKDRVEAKGATALRLWGSSDDDLKSKVGELGLLPWCDIQGGRPHHEWLASCDDVALFVLVLQQGEHYDLAIPGKLFEYVGMGRPVLAFVPDGEARRMINRNEWGCTFSGNPDPEAVASAIGKYFDRWRAGNLIPFNREATLVPFRRDRLAVSLGEILAHG